MMLMEAPEKKNLEYPSEERTNSDPAARYAIADWLCPLFR
jgi:hypothetical protein